MVIGLEFDGMKRDRITVNIKKRRKWRAENMLEMDEDKLINGALIYTVFLS